MAPVAVRRALDKVNRALNALRKAHPQPQAAPDALPANFVAALKQASAAMETHFAESAPGSADAALQQFYFDVLAFLRLAEAFDTHSVLELAEHAGPHGRAAIALRIQNLIPAPFLKPRFAAARTVTLFSATLSPPQYQVDMLGLPANTAWIDVESPFSPEQLQVRIVNRISTRYAGPATLGRADRAPHRRPVRAQAGNYLAFFSSFDYLDLVASEFQREHPDVPTWLQARGMDESQRNAFLARFVPGGAGVGFAVLGGSFGEGIDLRGDRLVGAFVATLGLPQVNPPQRAAQGLPGARVRRRLRLHLSLPGPAEGGAGGGPRDPHAGGSGRGVPDRRPLRAAGRPRDCCRRGGASSPEDFRQALELRGAEQPRSARSCAAARPAHHHESGSREKAQRRGPIGPLTLGLVAALGAGFRQPRSARGLRVESSSIEVSAAPAPSVLVSTLFWSPCAPAFISTPGRPRSLAFSPTFISTPGTPCCALADWLVVLSVVVFCAPAIGACSASTDAAKTAATERVVLRLFMQ